jgi:hypothetical protein
MALYLRGIAFEIYCVLDSGMHMWVMCMTHDVYIIFLWLDRYLYPDSEGGSCDSFFPPGIGPQGPI